MKITEEMIERVVERLRAIADETRVRLLLRLQQGPCNVTTLTDELAIGQASVSKHLSVLRQAGLVAVERRGTNSVYRIADESVFDMCRIVCDGVLRHLRRQQELLASMSEETSL